MIQAGSPASRCCGSRLDLGRGLEGTRGVAHRATAGSPNAGSGAGCGGTHPLVNQPSAAVRRSFQSSSARSAATRASRQSRSTSRTMSWKWCQSPSVRSTSAAWTRSRPASSDGNARRQAPEHVKHPLCRPLREGSTHPVGESITHGGASHDVEASEAPSHRPERSARTYAWPCQSDLAPP